MFDSFPVAFVGARFVPAAWNEGAWGVKKVQFFLKFFFKNLNRPRNNGESVSSLLPAQEESWGASLLSAC